MLEKNNLWLDFDFFKLMQFEHVSFVDSCFGIFVLFCATSSDEQTGGWKNEQTNEHFVLASSLVYPVVLCVVSCAVTHERGWLNIDFVFLANQKLIPLIVRDAIAVLWYARRSCGNRFASADALELLSATTNKETTPPGAYLIASGSDNPDFYSVTFCRAAIVSSAPCARPILSGRGQEGSSEIVWL